MRALRISDLPRGAGAAIAGGVSFVAYCYGSEARAEQRRCAIARARALHRRALSRQEDPYPTALVLGQRLSVALEDLARLLTAFEALPTDNAFDVLRSATIDELDAVYRRLAADPEAFRSAVGLPGPEDTEDLDAELREAVLEASDALARRWLIHWGQANAGWQLLRRLGKAMRHGTPLVPREIVLGPPGGGVLGRGLEDRFERWVLLVETEVDTENARINTAYASGDLSDGTLARAYQAGLDAVALARAITGLHVVRVRTESKWGFPREVFKLVSTEHAIVLKRESRA
jgi:hypothetical protein